MGLSFNGVDSEPVRARVRIQPVPTGIVPLAELQFMVAPIASRVFHAKLADTLASMIYAYV